MSVMAFLRPNTINHVAAGEFAVVHPLDDVREEKVDASVLGRMGMTASVKISLMTLRGYLVLMILLVLYHVIDLAGVFGQHAH